MPRRKSTLSAVPRLGRPTLLSRPRTTRLCVCVCVCVSGAAGEPAQVASHCAALCCPLLSSAVLCCPLLPSIRPVSSHENGHSRVQPRSLPTTPRPEWGCGGQQQSRLSLLGAARHHPSPGSTPKPERRLSPPQRQRQSRFSLSCFIRARAPHALRVFAPAHTLGCASLPGALFMSLMAAATLGAFRFSPVPTTCSTSMPSGWLRVCANSPPLTH
jgi:hypothetical protein